MQEDKFKRVYRAISTLLVSVPDTIKDEVKNALIDHALHLQDRSLKYIFVCLKNKKIDVLNSPLGRAVSVPYEDVEGILETESLPDPLFRVEDLNRVLSIAHYLAPSHHKFLFEMVKLARAGKETTVTRISKKCGFSHQRGSKVLAEIRKVIRERATEDGAEIKTIVELYDRLRQQRG